LLEIGAGGGSIAWIDEVGVVKVGPRSAGALPGPACYCRGGTHPTVTDAHAVIGTLSAPALQRSGIEFDREKAVAAIETHIAKPLGWPLARAAYAIIDIAVANMVGMMRLATTQRGIDPRNFVIVSTGGAGPLHATAVGKEIGVQEVIVPPYPGMFSALGAILGAVRHEFVRSVLELVNTLGSEDIKDGFADLHAQAERLLQSEPRSDHPPCFQRSIEARFFGQLHQLSIPIVDDEDTQPERIETAFRAIYTREYGFDLPQAIVQIVNLRLTVLLEIGTHATGLFMTCGPSTRDLSPSRWTRFITRDGREDSLPIYSVEGAGSGSITGPALIEHAGSTVWIHAGQSAVTGKAGEVIVMVGRNTC